MPESGSDIDIKSQIIYKPTQEDETQENLETCEYTREMRKNLDLNKEREHIILWKNIDKNLRELYKKVNLNTEKREKPNIEH